MLSFPSKNDKKFFVSDRKSVLKKTEPGNSKPIYFYIQSHSSYMYYIECIKLINIKKIPSHSNRFTMRLFIKK